MSAPRVDRGRERFPQGQHPRASPTWQAPLVISSVPRGGKQNLMPGPFSVRPDISKQSEIEERVMVELQSAELIYELATGQYRRAVRRCQELRPNSSDGNHGHQGRDGDLSVTAALEVQHYAFRNYRRALEVFTNFVQYGELPKLQSSPSPRGDAVRSVHTLQCAGFARLPKSLPSKLIHSEMDHTLCDDFRGTCDGIYMGTFSSKRGPANILVVDDEEPLRLMMEKMLRRCGCSVLHACSGDVALSVCERSGSILDLVVTDITMPGMSGFDLAEHIAERWPGLKMLFISGFADDHGIRRKLRSRPLLAKPFTAEDLTNKVRELLRGGLPEAGKSRRPPHQE